MVRVVVGGRRGRAGVGGRGRHSQLGRGADGVAASPRGPRRRRASEAADGGAVQRLAARRHVLQQGRRRAPVVLQVEAVALAGAAAGQRVGVHARGRLQLVAGARTARLLRPATCEGRGSGDQGGRGDRANEREKRRKRGVGDG